MIPSPILDGSPLSASFPAALRSPASLKGELSSSAGRPMLTSVPANDPAIDYIGRWDPSHTARWAGSSLRFAFSGPLLFLVPGDKTCSTNKPTVGWMVDGTSYTATATPGVSLRLWPPEGQASTPPRSPNLSSELAGFKAPSPAEESGVRSIEVSLIDWGSTLQVASFQILPDHAVSPLYPEGTAVLPTMCFVGASITSGFQPSHIPPEYYSGFYDSFASHLKQRLDPSVRMYAVAYPGIRLLDAPDKAGMESVFFKTGPSEGDPDWDFEERDSETGPTHIFVDLGTNDANADLQDVLHHYQNFLQMLKETYGRRTGDIFVLQPRGTWNHDEERYIPRLPELKDMVAKLSKEWENETPLTNGDLPPTPMLELAKHHLDPAQASHLLGAHLGVPSSTSVSSDGQRGNNNSDFGSKRASWGGPRPQLVVRPSSIAAVKPNEKGTRARLHFIDTTDWLDTREDTFDGLHPTRNGATKMARRLRQWLAENGFLR